MPPLFPRKRHHHLAVKAKTSGSHDSLFPYPLLSNHQRLSFYLQNRSHTPPLPSPPLLTHLELPQIFAFSLTPLTICSPHSSLTDLLKWKTVPAGLTPPMASQWPEEEARVPGWDPVHPCPPPFTLLPPHPASLASLLHFKHAKSSLPWAPASVAPLRTAAQLKCTFLSEVLLPPIRRHPVSCGTSLTKLRTSRAGVSTELVLKCLFNWMLLFTSL